MVQAHTHTTPARAPGLIRMPGPLVNKLLAWGVPMGPNVLVTIRGRRSGEPRTQPLAIFSDRDRRFLIGTFGDVNWCRNLRANPDIEIRRGRRVDTVRARELTREEAQVFFGETLPTGIANMPLYLKVFGRVFVRVTAPDMFSDPTGAAATHPVFEIFDR